MTESTVLDMGRGLFAMLDWAVYSFLGYFYEIMTEISKVMIISTDQSNAFATKIYTFLGIFMLFKITFSMINYIVNPEAISDKTKGVGKIAVNIVMVLVLIIITPTAFSKLYQLQNAIITDDLLPRLILGNVEESSLGKNELYFSEEYCGKVAITASDEGQYISLMMFRTFYQPDKDKYPDAEAFLEEDLSAKYCNESNNSVSDFLNEDIYNAAPGYKAKYSITYGLLISTAVGVFVALLFLSFSIDIAVRSIKLSFLQIISPIPIISYIDPESGKKGMFGKWLKDVGKTWADLFIRLIAIYFAVYIIGLIGSNGLSLKDFDGNELELNHRIMVGLFIIIGALVFAKRLPAIITDLTGIKLGGLELNPFKKIEKEALGGKILTSTPSAAIGFGLATADSRIAGNNWRDSLKAGSKGWSGAYKNPIKGLTSGMTNYKKTAENKTKGTAQLNELRKNWDKGEELKRKLTAGGVTNGKLDHTNSYDQYSIIYKKKEYIEALMGDNIAKHTNEDIQKKLSISQAYMSQNPDGVSAAPFHFIDSSGTAQVLAANTRNIDIYEKMQEEMNKSNGALKASNAKLDAVSLKNPGDAEVTASIKAAKSPVKP